MFFLSAGKIVLVSTFISDGLLPVFFPSDFIDSDSSSYSSPDSLSDDLLPAWTFDLVSYINPRFLFATIPVVFLRFARLFIDEPTSFGEEIRGMWTRLGSEDSGVIGRKFLILRLTPEFTIVAACYSVEGSVAILCESPEVKFTD